MGVVDGIEEGGERFAVALHLGGVGESSVINDDDVDDADVDGKVVGP